MSRWMLVILAGVTAWQVEPPAGPKKKVGYTDTPLLPGMKWRVHDPDRPQPPEVDPGTGVPPELPGKPPSDAVVLFDGKELSRWRTVDGREPGWILRGGVLEVPPPRTPGGGDLVTKDSFGDCQFHIEWAAPDPPQGDLMNRGNSGVYFFGLYEVQIFDSYRGGIYADGQAAAIYGQHPPMVNACRPPGEWQAFDILFRAPRFREGRLISPAFVTVLHNGVCVHHHREILGPTQHRALPKYVPHGPEGPIRLQAHGNPVRFRNIWVRPLREAEEP